MKPRQGHVFFSSKNPTPILDKSATPELPLLEEAANELEGLDDFQLLPSAAIDCEQAWGWDGTPATTLPASPDIEDSADERDSDDEHADTSDSVPCYHEVTSDAVPCSPEISYVKEEHKHAENECIPMWCLLEHDSGVMRVTPCVDGLISEPPNDGRSYMKLWCWTQVNASGASIVVPCTDKGVAEPMEQVDLAWLPPSVPLSDAAVVACSPAAPALDAYVPEWFWGPTWPFNAEPTTLMLSSLPAELTQDDLLEVLDREEFNGFYDFVFLPDDDTNMHNERYAIVNLIGHQYGLTLAAKLHGMTFGGVCDGDSPCNVTWALPYQGLNDLVRVYRHIIEDESDLPAERRPQIFSRGWPVLSMP